MTTREVAVDDQPRGTTGGDAVGPGDVLSDRYVLGERIGRGGMAEVFKAHDRRLGREVAVKVLAPHLLQDPQAVRQLQREARSAASIRHPGVVAVLDADNDAGTHYLVMELVDGPTLAEVLAERGPLPLDRLVVVGAAVADALQAAHERGVVHRDVKPSNVIFDGDGEVRVTDFGIAHAAAATTATDTALMAGSLPYLAPEQARGEDPSPTADLYALGCLLFESATGRPPFDRSTSAAVIAAHLHAEPPRPSDVRPELPTWLDDVVLRALSKDPAGRPVDAATLAGELRRGPPVDALATGRTATIPVAGASAADTVVLPPADREAHLPNRRRPWRWALVGAVTTVLVGAGFIGLTRLGEPTDPAPVAVASPTVPSPPSGSPTEAPVPPSPTTTTEPEPTPADPTAAATVVREHLDEARRSFRIDEGDADDLDDRLAEVVEKHREGKSDDALKKLDELDRKVEQLAQKGSIDADLHEALRAALDDLRAVL